MVQAKTKAGNQALPDHGKRPAHRIRVNLSFSGREIEVLEELARQEELKLSTYLRRIILRSAKVKLEAGVQRRMDAQGALGYSDGGDGRKPTKWSKARPPGEGASLFEVMAANVPVGQDDVPYYRTKEARALLEALPTSLSVRAERLMKEMHCQPSLEDYERAGIDLKAI